MLIENVSQAIDLMGGEARVSRWLMVHRSELADMRRLNVVERGCFAQFFITLCRMGYTPAPRLFGLESWETVTMPGTTKRRNGTKASTRLAQFAASVNGST
jgi:hypothetical protein